LEQPGPGKRGMLRVAESPILMADKGLPGFFSTI
jgi:hypothetical protein